MYKCVKYYIFDINKGVNKVAINKVTSNEFKLFLEEIRSKRETLGLSQLEIAKYLNIGKSAYSKMENGHARISPDRLQRICDKLNIDMSEINSTAYKQLHGATSKSQKLSKDYKKLLEQIRYNRNLSGISQIEMAKRLHLSQSVYGKMENGQIIISIERLNQICMELGVSIFSILREVYVDPILVSIAKSSHEFESKLIIKDKFFANIESMIHILGEKIQECLEVYAPGNKELYMKMEQIHKRHQDLLNAVDLYKL